MLHKVVKEGLSEEVAFDLKFKRVSAMRRSCCAIKWEEDWSTGARQEVTTVGA